MIGVDTNILVYAHREDSEWHEPAYARIARLAEGTIDLGAPRPCVHEFIAIAMFTAPVSLDQPYGLRDPCSWPRRVSMKARNTAFMRV